MNQFNFYYKSDPATFIPIFAVDDQAPLSPNQEIGSIDFVNGIVLDMDASAVQGSSKFLLPPNGSRDSRRCADGLQSRK